MVDGDTVGTEVVAKKDGAIVGTCDKVGIALVTGFIDGNLVDGEYEYVGVFDGGLVRVVVGCFIDGTIVEGRNVGRIDGALTNRR